jgi:uncharacterized protein
MPMPELTKNMSSLSLAELEEMASDIKFPPIDAWNPPLSGHSLIRIARDGQWYHDGELIARENLIRLFATILRRESDGSFVLVTPVEKQIVVVEDVPFAAVELKTEGAGEGRTIAFRLNIGDVVVAGAGHPLRFDLRGDEPAPYVTVRPGIEARIARSVFYELANIALEEGADPLGVWSKGIFYSMAAIA